MIDIRCAIENIKNILFSSGIFSRNDEKIERHNFYFRKIKFVWIYCYVLKTTTWLKKKKKRTHFLLIFYPNQEKLIFGRLKKKTPKSYQNPSPFPVPTKQSKNRFQKHKWEYFIPSIMRIKSEARVRNRQYISRGNLMENLILTTCYKNLRPSSFIICYIYMYHMCSFSLWNIKEEQESITGANGNKGWFPWEHLQEVQATTSHGSCSDRLYIFIFYHRSFLQSWDESSCLHNL